MLKIKDIDYNTLPTLIRFITNEGLQEEVQQKVFEAEIAIAISFNSEQYGNLRILAKTYTAKEMGLLDNLKIPKYLRSLDAARDLFRAFHGELENPFVYTILNDYGGLRRVRISEPLSGILVTVDGPTEETALVAATLKLAVLRRELTLKEANQGKEATIV